MARRETKIAAKGNALIVQAREKLQTAMEIAMYEKDAFTTATLSAALKVLSCGDVDESPARIIRGGRL
jgi:hypothetical protein